MNGYIYYISNSINDKLYIGKTIETLEERFKEHCRASRRQSCEKRPLYRAMRKYGVDKFSIHLIEIVNVSNLSDREIYWIDYYDSYHNGYNATRGGDGKILIDNNMIDLFCDDYRRGLTINEISEKYCIDTHTVLQKLRTRGVDTKANNVKSHQKSVKQYSITGKYIQSFSSQKEAAIYLCNKNHTNIKTVSTNIGRCAKGQRKTCCGYIWKYDNF